MFPENGDVIYFLIHVQRPHEIYSQTSSRAAPVTPAVLGTLSSQAVRPSSRTARQLDSTAMYQSKIHLMQLHQLGLILALVSFRSMFKSWLLNDHFFPFTNEIE